MRIDGIFQFYGEKIEALSKEIFNRKVDLTIRTHVRCEGPG